MKHWMLAIGLVLGGAMLVGCGDSGGGGKALCMETCEKSNECFGGSTDCAMQCEGGSDGSGSCSNSGEIADHISMCNSGECGDMGTEYSTCLGEAPACE